ncbi:MAG: hypothetical protein HY887_06240 [Deltaproteobacteria bacterium]|nr:hypothetical protein [Deltaproteobacteria bacterium]
MGGLRFLRIGVLAAAAAALYFVLQGGRAFADAPVNIPAGSSFYDDIERLEVKGLISSAIFSTRPFTRAEGARLVREADENRRQSRHPFVSLRAKGSLACGGACPERSEGARAGAGALIERLKNEFRYELSDSDAPIFIKPAGGFYLKHIYAGKTPYFAGINNNGDTLRKGQNERAGFVFRAGLFDAMSVYLNPEYRADDDNADARVVHGYMAFRAGGIDIEAGKDSMWWGSGYHGGLLMTNNAEPFRMVKATVSSPAALPSVFSRLGLFKPTVFIARLEKERDFPRARLLGMRLDFKPTDRFQFALSRVFIFGGRGRRALSFADWVSVLLATDKAEHDPASPIDGDQIVSIDASYVYVNEGRPFLPFSGIKLYTEWGAEDSSGRTRTPSGRADICGFFIDEPLWIKNTDFRLEWANTGRSARYGPLWYEHGVYTSGYRYFGRFIGHHMGGDAQDLFLMVRYHMQNGASMALEHDKERSGIHGGAPAVKRWSALDISYPVLPSAVMRLIFGWGIEKTTLGADTVLSLNISFAL